MIEKGKMQASEIDPVQATMESLQNKNVLCLAVKARRLFTKTHMGIPIAVILTNNENVFIYKYSGTKKGCRHGLDVTQKFHLLIEYIINCLPAACEHEEF